MSSLAINEFSVLIHHPGSSAPLLRRALDALGMRLVLVIVLHGIRREASRVAVNVLQVGRLAHGLGRRGVDDVGCREVLPESLKGGRILGPVLLGELDGELDVHVAEIVMPVGRHALAADHLDGTWEWS